MNTPASTRRLACEFAIAASICGAGYYFLVDSARGKLAGVCAQISEAESREAALSGVGGLTDIQVMDLRRLTLERVAQIKKRSAPAADEATMFAAMSGIAGTHNLRIEQLSPVMSAPGASITILPPGVQPGTPGAAQAAEQAAAAPKDTRASYNISISGGYADIAAFLESMSRSLGYTVIRSVRLTQPDSAIPDLLRAEISSDHLGFDLSAIKLPTAAAGSTLPPTPAPTPAPAPADAGRTVSAEHAP